MGVTRYSVGSQCRVYTTVHTQTAYSKHMKHTVVTHARVWGDVLTCRNHWSRTPCRTSGSGGERPRATRTKVPRQPRALPIAPTNGRCSPKIDHARSDRSQVSASRHSAGIKREPSTSVRHMNIYLETEGRPDSPWTPHIIDQHCTGYRH